MCVFLGYGIGQLISPLNYATVKGAEIRLTCSKRIDEGGFWFRNAPLSFDQVLIYHRTIKNGLFAVNESIPERSELIFMSSNRTSGRYGCHSVYATHTAEVIVTGQFYRYTSNNPIEKRNLDCHRFKFIRPTC